MANTKNNSDNVASLLVTNIYPHVINVFSINRKDNLVSQYIANIKCVHGNDHILVELVISQVNILNVDFIISNHAQVNLKETPMMN